MRQAIIIPLALTLLAAGCGTPPPQINNQNPAPTAARALTPTHSISLGEHDFHVQIARTEAEKTLGLSDITAIKNNEGMLFLFDPPATPSFWMKNMRFPIDLVWIYDNKIVSVERNVSPPSANADTNNLQSYTPPSPVDMVLEINANTTDIIKVDSEIKLKP